MTGAVPFDGPDERSVALARLRQPAPPLRRLRPDAVLASAGAGVTFFDGAFRIDVARALVKSSRLALELSLDASLFPLPKDGLRVRFDRLDPAPFALDIGTSENLVLNANGGNDRFSATGKQAALITITVDEQVLHVAVPRRLSNGLTIIGQLPEERASRILVISCGPGYLVNTLKRHGYENVTGIDSDAFYALLVERLARL